MNRKWPVGIVVYASLAEAALSCRRQSELIVWQVANGLKTSPGGYSIPRQRLMRCLG